MASIIYTPIDKTLNIPLNNHVKNSNVVSSCTFNSFNDSINSAESTWIIALLDETMPSVLVVRLAPTSKNAITKLKVFESKYTAIAALKTYLKKLKVSISCMLFFSFIICISS